jgi:DNA-binding CsgD family transcriptional regulator
VVKTHYFKLAIYIVVIVFFFSDLWFDYVEEKLDGHFYLELLLTILVFYLFAHQINQLQQVKLNLLTATNTIKNLQGEMVNYIDQKFIQWELTKVENQVAWLIIKGFSFKEIAHIREVTEKTIAQQSSAVYKKSGVHNRHELMSEFLEEFINFNE